MVFLGQQHTKRLYPWIQFGNLPEIYKLSDQ
jgi:hypothetical protein